MKVQLDSRLVKPGEYFVPIKGENFDGHTFIEKAIEAGAKGIIGEEELYELASKKLHKINPKVIAVTGSVGKTTMRDFLTQILSQKYKVCTGTLNTKLGLAVNIINDMKSDTQIFVAETGMDQAGELTKTGNFINPDIAVITNISESHMEKLGSLQAIIDAKFEIVLTVKQDGAVFLNGVNENCRSLASRVPANLQCFTYGFPDKSKEHQYKFNFIGIHNYVNATGAITVAKYLSMTDIQIKEAVSKIKVPKGRLSMISGISGSIIIDDTYNASPISCLSALESVDTFYRENKMQGRKIAILGGMLELGKYEDEGHLKVGEGLVDYNFDVIVLVGDLAKKYKLSKKLVNSKIDIYESGDSILAGKFAKNHIIPQKADIILVKGSQGIRMEKAVELIMKNPTQAKTELVRQDIRWK